MTEPTGVLTEPSRAATAVIGLTGAFLALLVALHFLEPQYDPSHRMISEYAVGRYGALMQGAFVTLGVALLGLRSLLRAFIGRRSLGLTVMGLALFGAAAFKTDLLTEPVSHPVSHAIHQACGAIVILGFPGVVTLLALRLGRHPLWASARRWLYPLTALTWAGQLAFFVAVKTSGRPPVGAVGWPNRLMMLAYCAWMAAVARQAALRPR